MLNPSGHSGYLIVEDRSRYLLTHTRFSKSSFCRPKFLQISALTSVSDLSAYQVEVYFNGNTSPGATLALDSVVLEPCESWVIGDNDETLTPFEADQEVTNSLWNGDDAIILRRISDNAIMDSIGQVGVDPGSAYTNNGVSTLNQSLCRKSTITSGDTDASDAFDPSIEWNTFAENTFFTEMDSGCKCFSDSGPGPTDPTSAPSQAPTTTPLDVFIHDIQGSGFTSPLVGERVRVQAVVIGDFQNGDSDEERNLGGFWIQEEDSDADADPTTSEGCLVLDEDVNVDVLFGDIVIVIGIVGENFGNTVIEAESVESFLRETPLRRMLKLNFPGIWKKWKECWCNSRMISSLRSNSTWTVSPKFVSIKERIVRTSSLKSTNPTCRPLTPISRSSNP